MVSKETKKEAIQRLMDRFKQQIGEIDRKVNELSRDVYEAENITEYLSCYVYDRRYKNGGEIEEKVKNIRKQLYELDRMIFEKYKIRKQ